MIVPRTTSILRCLASVWVLYCIALPATMAQPVVSFQPSELTISKGDTVYLDCNVQDVEQLRGISVHIVFNKSVLRFIDAEEGDFLHGNPDGLDVFFFVTRRPEQLPDSVLIDQAIAGLSAASGSGKLFRLCFVADNGGVTGVSLKNLDLRDRDNERLEASGTGSSVTVRSGTNRAPSKPFLLAPTDSMTLHSFTDTLHWSRSEDPDGDPVSYSVHISGGSTDTVITARTDTFYPLGEIELAQLTTYFWYVQARDHTSIARSDQTYRFTTPASTSVAPPPRIVGFEILSLAPNPATAGVWIRHLQNRSASIRISVVDNSGRRVLVRSVYYNTPGIHSYWIPLSNLPPGIYSCICESQSLISIKRFVLVR